MYCTNCVNTLCTLRFSVPCLSPDLAWNTVRSRHKRQLIQMNINKSGLHGLEWKTRDPYSVVNDSLISRTHCSFHSQRPKEQMAHRCRGRQSRVLGDRRGGPSFCGVCPFGRRLARRAPPRGGAPRPPPSGGVWGAPSPPSTTGRRRRRWQRRRGCVCDAPPRVEPPASVSVATVGWASSPALLTLCTASDS